MSKLYLQRFLNLNRPILHDAIVNDIPVDSLEPEDITQLRDSMTVDDDDDILCAASARLWETLLEDHRLPFLILRVADMRVALERESTAIGLYEELTPIVDNEDFSRWVSKTRIFIENKEHRQLSYYKTSTSFNPSQRWRPTAKVDVFPHYRLQRTAIDDVKTKWTELGRSDSIMKNYYRNLSCVETNTIEGTFGFDLSSTTKLIQVGFYNQVIPSINDPIVGGVRDRETALSILQDTRKALDIIFSFLESGSNFILTPEHILKLHGELMRTSRVMCQTRSSGDRYLAYVSTGVTRQTSRINVTAMVQQGSIKVQFCPFDFVDSELEEFCKRFNTIVHMEAKDMDPFAAAAWISHVFVTIHPFEDGNGRVSRLLASIPLLINGLPPLSIPTELKVRYIQELNSVRANRPDGYYNDLIDVFYSATTISLEKLKSFSEDA